MDIQKKHNLAKAQENVQKKKALEAEQLRSETEASLKGFVDGLADVLGRGIKVDGISDVDLLVSRVEEYGQRVSEFVGEIARCTAAIPNLDELTLPSEITLKSVTDDLLISTLRELGDQNELISKLQSLDQAVVLLAAALEKDQSAGQKAQDYTPVRIVLGRDDKLKFLENWPMPSFNTGGQSGGLTDAELRASPVPVSATIDTTGLATDAGQATGNASLSSIDTKLSTLTTAVGTIISKATDAYSIAAISDDGTYKYFWFEDAALNYYIMRKTKATSIFLYTKGTGGYASVYQSSILGPSGSPTFASYGNTF